MGVRVRVVLIRVILIQIRVLVLVPGVYAKSVF